ncbi:MAG: DMT family transporter [Proteobacteria bacterium]|nr:DMT family transporter [Pseudomonadota bacterium]MBU1612466.1 DMT family transporter [Pseudomonadota bacterium]
MQTEQGKALIYLKLVATMTLWGGTFIAGRLLADMGATSGALLRFVAATAFLLAVTLRKEGRLAPLPRSQWGKVTFLAFTGVFLYNICFLYGLQTVPAGRASLIIASIPAIIAVASALLFKERLTALKVLGVALSIIGAMTVISRGDLLMVFDHASLGDLFILGCVGSWAAYSLMGKQVMGELSPLAAVTWSCILGTIMLLPVALGTGLAGELAQATPVDWLSCVYLGVCGTGLGFTWYYQGIQRLGAARAGVFINLVPVNAVTMGCLLLGEPVGLSLLAGAALIITGVYLVNKPPRLRPAA